MRNSGRLSFTAARQYASSYPSIFHHPPSTSCPLTPKNSSLTSDMSQISSSSSSFHVLFGVALQDYENRTGIRLINHPFAKQLDECNTLDSINTIIQEQAKGFQVRGDKGTLMKSLNCSVDVLHTLSTSTVLGEVVGVVRPKQSSAFLVLDSYFAAIPTCESHIRWDCHPPQCMSLSLQSQLHISLTSKFGRR